MFGLHLTSIVIGILVGQIPVVAVYAKRAFTKAAPVIAQAETVIKAEIAKVEQPKV